jgi:hypothetical protein
MDDPQAAIETEKVSGRSAERPRLFWGAIWLALAAWGQPPAAETDIRLTLADARTARSRNPHP